MKLITIITDFGYDSPYIGSVKAKIHSITQGKAQIIDIFHEVEKHNILSAMYWIYYLYRDYPEGTSFLCVVDPTVGTERKGILVEFEKRFFIGPDNGIFTLFIKKGGKVYELPPPPEKASPTFHARDYFSIWVSKITLSPFIIRNLKEYREPVLLEIEEPVKSEKIIKGHMVLKDRFGNILTDIENEWIQNGKNYILKTKKFLIEGPKRTYAEVKKGKLIFLKGSFGFIEIAANMKSAFDIIKPHFPEKIEIREKENF